MVSRREFLATSSSVFVGSVVLGQRLHAGEAASEPMVGIQVGSVSFVDEGTEKVLDILQETANVNTLFLV